MDSLLNHVNDEAFTVKCVFLRTVMSCDNGNRHKGMKKMKVTELNVCCVKGVHAVISCFHHRAPVVLMTFYRVLYMLKESSFLSEFFIVYVAP